MNTLLQSGHHHRNLVTSVLRKFYEIQVILLAELHFQPLKRFHATQVWNGFEIEVVSYVYHSPRPDFQRYVCDSPPVLLNVKCQSCVSCYFLSTAAWKAPALSHVTVSSTFFLYDCGLWSEDPSRDCLMAPNQSASTSIGLTSGWVIPLKNLPYSCKYSAGETLKVWGARGVFTIAKWRKAPICQIIWRVLHL